MSGSLDHTMQESKLYWNRRRDASILVLTLVYTVRTKNSAAGTADVDSPILSYILKFVVLLERRIEHNLDGVESLHPRISGLIPDPSFCCGAVDPSSAAGDSVPAVSVLRPPPRARWRRRRRPAGGLERRGGGDDGGAASKSKLATHVDRIKQLVHGESAGTPRSSLSISVRAFASFLPRVDCVGSAGLKPPLCCSARRCLCGAVGGGGLCWAVKLANCNLYGTIIARVPGFLLDGWKKCWEQGLTPWDLGQPTPILQQLHQMGALPKGRALVPGCGSGYDVASIACPERYVVGIDISEGAIKRATQLFSSSPNANHFIFLKEDFFTWNPTELFDLIFDYTFFCAIEPEIRAAWAERMSELLAPDGELITLMFPIGDHIDGPPYKVSISDYEEVLCPLGFKAISIMDNELAVGSRKGKEKIGWWKKIIKNSTM
ncbi:hypothetical protein NL676_019139 [Syzygium grande]|nr:hypothetical protein NL676_019139 [Syzygium grande]